MNRLLALAGCLFAFCAQALTAVDSAGATAGKWTYDVAAARKLADTTDRPLLVMFSNSSGECGWCNLFETKINSSEDWRIYATEQQLAMAYINYNGPNWDATYYQAVYSDHADITGFPAFVLYSSTGTNVLSAFSYNSTNVTFTSEAFISKVASALGSTWTLTGQDIWDHADDTAVGATVLGFQPYNLRQSHTLNKVEDADTTPDTDDWFKFLCVKGRKYKFQIPSYDYTITFSASVTGGWTNTLSNTNLPAGFSSSTVTNPASTNWVNLGTSTNVLGSLLLPSQYPEGTNFLIQIVTNLIISTTNLPPRIVSTNYSETISTNLSGGSSQPINTGTPPDVIVPTITFYDPSREVRLEVDAGPLGTTNTLMLTSLTNGCVYAPPDEYANSYCFLHVKQEITNDLSSFDGVIYNPPTTNLTIRIAHTNTTTYTATRETVSNAWMLITISPPDPGYFMLITSNLVGEAKTRTVTNSVTERQTYSATNSVVTESTNTVTYLYDSTAYTLNYRLWEPGEIVFSPTAVSVSETASSVKLTVTRKGGSAGEVLVRYRFEDASSLNPFYTAQDGQDFKAVEGELYWADDQSGSTNITVDLIQDLRPTWEGDERFAVVLQKHPQAQWFQAAVGAASNAVVTLKESATKKAGKLTFSGSGDSNTPFPSPTKPALNVTEGNTFTLWVARSGGSNGTARGSVSLANAPTGVEIDGSASEPLEWEDGDESFKQVQIITAERDGFNNNTPFTVKLSGVTGASLGSPSSVAITLLDQSVAYTLADTAALAAAAGVTFKASAKNWFWSDPERTTLRCEPLNKGGKAVLQLTLTGPGLLSFDWEMSDWSSPDALVCSGNIVSKKTLSASDGSASLLVKPGKKTVTLTYTKGTVAHVEAFASLKNMMWQPLPKATDPEPATGSQTSPTELTWVTPAATSVMLGGDFTTETNGVAVTCTAVALSPSGNSVSDAPSSVAFDVLWKTDAPVDGTTYKWRVDTVLEHADGRLMNTGDTWLFKALSTTDSTEAPPGANEDGLCEALQGVTCDFGVISETENLTYAVVGGSLPPGLTLTAATGQIKGVPTKAGTWTVTLQATSTETGSRVRYRTVTLAITVYPLGFPVGTYTGWTTTDREGLPYSGSGTVTMSQVGDLSAKVTVDGTAYSFSKKGFDRADNPAAPTYVECDSVYGSTVTATDGKYTNTLESVLIGTNGCLTATLTLYTLTKNADGTTEATPTTHQVELFKNTWSDAYMKRLLGAFTGYYTVALPVSATLDASTAPLGSGYVTLTVGAGGSVKLSGVLADGTTWSLATTLLYLDAVDTNDTSTAEKTAHVYVCVQPAVYAKNGGFCGTLRITTGTSYYGNVVDCSDESGTLQWWNLTPTSVYGATGPTVTDATGFRNEVAAAGGYYDTIMNLQTYYLGKTLTFKDSALASDPSTPMLDLLPPDYDGRGGGSGYTLLSAEGLIPFGTPLVVGAQSLSAAKKNVVLNDTDQASNPLEDCIDFDESTNVAGLTLSLKRATGLLTGSFNLVYERENMDGAFVRHTRSVAIKGLHTPVRPQESDEDPSADVQGAGFYLIPETGSYLNATGRNVTYPFNWSFAFELFSEN